MGMKQDSCQTPQTSQQQGQRPIVGQLQNHTPPNLDINKVHRQTNSYQLSFYDSAVFYSKSSTSAILYCRLLRCIDSRCRRPRDRIPCLHWALTCREPTRPLSMACQSLGVSRGPQSPLCLLSHQSCQLSHPTPMHCSCKEWCSKVWTRHMQTEVGWNSVKFTTWCRIYVLKNPCENEWVLLWLLSLCIFSSSAKPAKPVFPPSCPPGSARARYRPSRAGCATRGLPSNGWKRNQPCSSWWVGFNSPNRKLILFGLLKWWKIWLKVDLFSSLSVFLAYPCCFCMPAAV